MRCSSDSSPTPWLPNNERMHARRQILKEIIEKKEGMGDMMKKCFFSLTEAVYSAGDSVKHTISDNVETATIKVNGGLDNVAGVKIPKVGTRMALP